MDSVIGGYAFDQIELLVVVDAEGQTWLHFTDLGAPGDATGQRGRELCPPIRVRPKHLGEAAAALEDAERKVLAGLARCASR